MRCAQVFSRAVRGTYGHREDAKPVDLAKKQRAALNDRDHDRI
jgi:hypothetical protein